MTHDIVEQPELQIAEGFTMTSKGLLIAGSPTFEQWEAVGKTLRFLESSIQFAIGDWLRYGERRWGEKYAQAVEETGYSDKSLREYAWVSGAVDLSIRMDNLPFAHHHIIAPLRKDDKTPDTERQRYYLELAAADELSAAQLRKRIRQDTLNAGLHPAQNLTRGVYNVIYADPPWQYDNAIEGTGAAYTHYPTMPLEDIECFLEAINLRVDDNAVLFMWVTNPFVKDAFTVLGRWGFEYKSNMVWVKTDLVKPGSGFYVRGRHELLFICTRGSFTPLDANIAPPIGSVIEAPVQEHSRKPDVVYELIERLYPQCHYVELFSRNTREGWDSVGNQIG